MAQRHFRLWGKAQSEVSMRQNVKPGIVARASAGLLGLLLAAALSGGPVADCGAGALTWETWGTETCQLGAGESFQFQVTYDQIPVRSWRLMVEGDYVLSDLHILRLKDESLLYYVREESRHEALIPWGKGEEILVVLTASGNGGVYTVNFLGPPAGTAPASFSYLVNRALEAYAAGKRLDAEQLCQAALDEDPTDSVARVMLAGFLRDRHFYERAHEMVLAALAEDPEREYYQREIAKLAGISIGATSQKLRKLSEDGLVNVRKSGRMMFYRYNLRDPLTKQLKILL